jgi:LmbE family N-acetylglucosaminyl deacetylase
MSPSSLAVCVAHPDDEAYAAYGSVALHRDDPGFRLVVLHATDGDAGQVGPGVDVQPGLLGEHRKMEDERGWQAVGRVPDRHDWLGYPDGALAEVPFAPLVSRVAAFLDAERPDVVLTFGPDGLTGHPDHVAIGRATDAAFHAVRADGGPGLRRLLHTGIRESFFQRQQAWLVDHGFTPWDPTRLYHPRGIPDDLIGVEVRTGAVSERVLAGLLEHRSQHHVLFAPLTVDDTGHIRFSRESHVVAWPPRHPGQECLPDIFAGLDTEPAEVKTLVSVPG